MRISDLRPSQLRNMKVFNLLLEYAGWEDVEEVEKRLDSGESVEVIAQQMTCFQGMVLEARLHGFRNCILLDVLDTDSGKQAEIQLYFTEQPDRLLEWLTSHAAILNLQNYAQCLADVAPHCERILVEAESLVYEIHLS
jgi:hypothetical protein